MTGATREARSVAAASVPRVVQVMGSSAGGVARHVGQVAALLAADGVHVLVAGPEGSLRTARAGAGAAPPVAAADPVRASGTGGRDGGRPDHEAVPQPPGMPAGDVVAHPALREVEVPIADRPHPRDVVAVARLRRLARGADVLHAHGLRAGALAVLAVRTLPRSSGGTDESGVHEPGPRTHGPAHRPRVVVTLHNLPVGGRAIRAVSALLETVVARGADEVLAVSGDLELRARERGARSTGRALVPAPPGPAPAAAATAAEVRAALGLAADRALLVTVARLAPQKGLDTLAATAALLRDRALLAATSPSHTSPGSTPPAHPPHVVWAVAGDGPLHDELAARVTAQDLPVLLLGRRDDVPNLLAAADVVVSTAVWEGQPIALQEALRVGAPVVATDAGGTADVTGPAAVLVPVGDAAALADAITGLLTDARARDALAASALARAAAAPTAPDVVAQLRRAYRV